MATTEPQEHEQRWLVKPDALDELLAHATARTRMIQGYMPESTPNLARRLIEQDGATHLVITKQRTIPKAACIREEMLLNIPLKEEHAALLKTHLELLNRMRFRYATKLEHPEDKKAYITIKGPATNGSGSEVEEEIPVQSGIKILNDYCKKKLLGKVRHNVGSFEVDVFDEGNKVKAIAEREVLDAGLFLNQAPQWAERDVTNDKNLTNFAMSGPSKRLVEELKKALQDMQRERT